MLHASVLRIGLIVDAEQVPRWIAAIIEEIRQSEIAEVVLYVICETHEQHSRRESDESFLYRRYRRIDHRLFRPFLRSPDPFTLVPLETMADAAAIRRVGLQNGACSEADSRFITEKHVDVLLTFSAAALDRAIVQAARYGVWRYRHRDIEQYPAGGPVGFWEVYDQDPVIGSVLERLTDDEEAGTILYRSWTKTQTLSLYLTRARVYRKSAPFVMRCLRQLAAGRLEGRSQAERAPKRLRTPSNLRMIWFGLRLLKRLVGMVIQEKLLRSSWSIGWRETDAPGLACSEAAASPPFQEIPSAPDRFYADPFVCEVEGQTWLFCEEYSYAEKQGCISAAAFGQGVWSAPKTVLKPAYHLSFPFVFEWQGAMYLIPESSQNRTIELYKAQRFPEQWELIGPLLEDVIAVDTVVFEYQGKLWLFTSLSAEAHDTRDELSVFFADSLLGQWQPHPMNPVVSDIRTARNAGRIFVQEGKIFRPSQDCSVSYGHGIYLNQITCLTETDYREHVVSFLRPRWKQGLIGVHTFNRVGRMEVVDGQHWEWNFPGNF
jgi:hypothetical protein